MSNSAQTSASSRIAALLDENSFVEVGAYIAARNTDFNMTEQETPADGVVTGYGTIGGCLVYVYSQDACCIRRLHGRNACKENLQHLFHGYEDGSTCNRFGRLCRSASSGGDRCPGRLRQAVLKPDHGFRRDSSDNSNLWNLRRRHGSICRHHRFHLHGREVRQNCLLIHLTPLDGNYKAEV